ncbi:MAG: DeoR family transcriptional regulator, partial [Candidatus Caldatribacteriaceae bacterium]
MRKKDRLDYIGRQLALKSMVTIKELSEELGVSGMTVRRDLQDLAKDGILKLIPGGAVLQRESSIINQQEYAITRAKSRMTKEKIKICKKAASLIQEEDTIIIDTGST